MKYVMNVLAQATDVDAVVCDTGGDPRQALAEFARDPQLVPLYADNVRVGDVTGFTLTKDSVPITTAGDPLRGIQIVGYGSVMPDTVEAMVRFTEDPRVRPVHLALNQKSGRIVGASLI